MADAALVEVLAPLRSEQCIPALRAGDDRAGLTDGSRLPGSQFHDASSLSLTLSPDRPLVPHARDVIVKVCAANVKQRR